MNSSARSILWHSATLPSTERCVFREGIRWNRVHGTVLTVLGGGPCEIRYRVECDPRWRTRTTRLRVFSPSTRHRCALRADGEARWELDGAHIPDLDGVFDVDLGFSPCTNTLPIRRLRLEIDQTERIAVAWLRFPQLDVVRSVQVYKRLDRHLYRFDSGSGDFTTQLEVDERGVVIRYGDLWRELPPDPG